MKHTPSVALAFVAAFLAGCGGQQAELTPTKTKAASTETGKGSKALTQDDAGSISGENAPRAAASNAKPRARSFRFNYGFHLKELPAASNVRVWIPVPPSNEHQTAAEIERKVPVAPSVASEPKYGNQIMYLGTKAPESGDLSFGVSYQIDRMEVRFGQSKSELTDEQRKTFLSANAKVPIDGAPLELLNDVTLPESSLALGRVLYNRVDEHMRYDKSNPGYGNGDVLWVCDSRFGNCTDFHSLFISLTRSQGVPARFEIGFPIPDQRGEGKIGGYHCWAFFHTNDQGWVPTDISEADKHPEMRDYYFGNLTENRVTFTVGRDIDLVPQQVGPPLNFFVYPYAEVDGKRLDKKQMELDFLDV